MINTKKNGLVILQSGTQLHESIVAAFKEVSMWTLDAYQLTELDLSLVSTKNFLEAALPAHIERFILSDPSVPFDEQYVRAVFEFVVLPRADSAVELYAAVTRNPNITGPGPGGYRKAFVPPLRRGFSTFLLALHLRRAIVLPFCYLWPQGLDKGYKGKVLRIRELCPYKKLPELLRLIRSWDYHDPRKRDPVFSTYEERQRDHVIGTAKKLLVCLGWLKLSDANYDDMLALREENSKTCFSGRSELGLYVLVDLLERRFKDDSPINREGWRFLLSQSKPKKAFDDLKGASNQGHCSLVQIAASLDAVCMAPDVLANINTLPELGADDIQRNCKIWVVIEQIFLKKIKLENKHMRRQALGFFNIYLFGYLPLWYATNPGFEIEYPSLPSKLLGEAFVSELGLLKTKERPVTLINFLNIIAGIRKWNDTTHYGIIKQLELFFGFIERHEKALPDSSGFRQPIHWYDFPKQHQSKGTKKRPIPRRIFKLILGYVEVLLELSYVITERVLTGQLNLDHIPGILVSFPTIDCFSLQNEFGFVPIVFLDGRAYPLRWIPNVLNVEAKPIKRVGTLKIPHPHALHQILVSLYTGLRHNHIQWLDKDTFDKHLPKEASDFAELYVNTDKTKKEGWMAFVNFRVIELLRRQKKWRDLVDSPGFNENIFYNDNSESKWGNYIPLFSFSKNGKPHSDEIYFTCWSRLLTGWQGLLNETGESSIRLFRLLPPGVNYGDSDLEKKLLEYGAEQTDKCKVKVKSNITPHSARVSVVSHSITILPADLIGSRLTGQTNQTVYYYVALDDEEIFAEQQRQQLYLRDIGYERGYEAMLRASPGQKGPYIKADSVNSNLSISLRTNIEEAIKDYGCVSLGFGEKSCTGLDVLRETRATGMVASKTEICPYGRQCPSQIVTELKGWQRCGPCPMAVRSIDHLPAVSAKIRQVKEGLDELDLRIAQAEKQADMSDDEFDSLEENRSVLAEDMAAWCMSAEVLEHMRQKIAADANSKRWYVRKPEIVERHLRQVPFPTDATSYLLARLTECEAFPMLESPQVRARFLLLRQQILVNAGNLRDAFVFPQSQSPAAECLGLIRAIVSENNFTIDDLKAMIESDSHLATVPARGLLLLPSFGD